MGGLDDGTYFFFGKFAGDTPTLGAVLGVFDVLSGLIVLGAAGGLLIALLVAIRRYRSAVVQTAVIAFGLAAVELLNRLIRVASAKGMALTPTFINRTTFLSSLILSLWAFVGWRLLGGTRLLVACAILLLVVAIGFSQLYLGHTFLSGLLAGWDFGVLCALLCYALTRRGAPRAAHSTELS